MSTKVNQAWLNALATIEICEQRLAALHFAMKGIRSNDKGLSGDFTRLHCELWQNCRNAYAEAFMWGVVTRKPEHLKEARQIAFKQYLHEQQIIIQYLRIDHEYPGHWAEQEEKEFRQELDDLKFKEE